MSAQSSAARGAPDPGAPTAEQCIAGLEAAKASGEAQALTEAMARFGQLQVDGESWPALRIALEKHGITGMLQLLTGRYIEQSAPSDVKPYLVLAKLLTRREKEEAASLLNGFIARHGLNRPSRWPVLMLLFEARDWQATLNLTAAGLRDEPASLYYLAMECRCLWQLGRRWAANRKLKRLAAILGDKVDDWVWFAALAQEFRKDGLAYKAVKRMLALIDRNGIPVTSSAIYLLQREGRLADCRRLLGTLKAENYSKPEELGFLFDEALGHGLYEQAKALGERLMATEPSARTRDLLAEAARKASLPQWRP